MSGSIERAHAAKKMTVVSENPVLSGRYSERRSDRAGFSEKKVMEFGSDSKDFDMKVNLYSQMTNGLRATSEIYAALDRPGQCGSWPPPSR